MKPIENDHADDQCERSIYRDSDWKAVEVFRRSAVHASMGWRHVRFAARSSGMGLRLITPEQSPESVNTQCRAKRKIHEMQDTENNHEHFSPLLLCEQSTPANNSW